MRKAAAQHDDVRVEDVDHVRKPAGKAAGMTIQARSRLRVAAPGAGRNLLARKPHPRDPLMIGFQARTRHPRLHAPVAAAPAARARMLVARRPRQRVVAPFSADVARPVDEPAVEHQSAAAARAQDHAEHRSGTGRCAIDRLRQGKAVGIIGQADRAAQMGFDIARERLAVEPRGIGVLHQAARGRYRARHADADAAARAGLCSSLAHHVADGAQRRCVVVPRRRDAMLGHDCAIGSERHAGNLGAAQVDAEAHLGFPRLVHHDFAVPAGCLLQEDARAGATVSGATEVLAANTSRSDSSPTRCSSTAARNSGDSTCSRIWSGVNPVSVRKRDKPRRLLRQERKPLSGNAFRRFQGQIRGFSKHASFVTIPPDHDRILNSWLRILQQSRLQACVESVQD